MPFQSTKTYGHDLGLSCAFRQWRAESHCNKLHGYALSVKLTFGCSELNDCNWVMDFGGLKPVKQFLESVFDHKTLVALDDPNLADFRLLYSRGLIDLQVVDGVGCEAFAMLISDWVEKWLEEQGDISPAFNSLRVWLISTEVREHGANSAIYLPVHQ